MKLYPIESGNFKLDGGAMFGVVPKTIWNRTNPADEKNLIDLATRCLLIEDGNRLILIDNGMGDKQSEKFFGYYSLWGTHSIDKSLAKYGFHRDDITDVFLTHLHFDHCGGSVKWNKDKTGYEVAFKNAKYWTNENHWEWATKPNQREKASFLHENIIPMQESGQLNFIKKPENDFKEFSGNENLESLDDIDFRTNNGGGVGGNPFVGNYFEPDFGVKKEAEADKRQSDSYNGNSVKKRNEVVDFIGF